MNRRWLSWLGLALAFAGPAKAHVGSPDVFYDGLIGPYPARITIRMPGVVPGRAEISVRAQTDRPVEVSFLPLFSKTAVTNAPPPDRGQLVPGEKNLYRGELWLMSFGAYSIAVRMRGEAGEGTVEIPVNSVATRQLPLPGYLGKLLLGLGALLVLGGLGIVAAAARESALAPGVLPGPAERRKGWLAGALTAVIFALLLVGGSKWWSYEETTFRRHLREGAWPDLAADVRVEGSQRILRLTVGEKASAPDHSIRLLPDHGKLIHLFLVREGSRDAFGHLHPVRKGAKTFEVALPPLPEGRYKIFCDLTFEQSGVSSTATNSVQLPAVPGTVADAVVLKPDPDDSWAIYSGDSVPAATTANPVCRLPGGEQVEWTSHPPLRIKQDAALRFEVRDAAGHPVDLEPYMGMTSHAAVLRADGAIFSHLHPAGNFSMAAQSFFEAKLERETGAAGEVPTDRDHSKMDHSKMGHGANPGHSNSGVASISLPYEFPAAGDYRLWVQFKINGQVMTAVFDATVAAN
jgi:hypothetical protein